MGLMGEDSARVLAAATGGGGGIGLIGDAENPLLTVASDAEGTTWIGEAIAIETNIAKAALIIRRVPILRFFSFLFIAVRSLVHIAKKDYPKLCRSSSTKVIICAFSPANSPFLFSARPKCVLGQVIFV